MFPPIIFFDLLGKTHSAKIPCLFFWLSAGGVSTFPECANEEVCGALYTAPRLSCELMTFSTQEAHWVV